MGLDWADEDAEGVMGAETDVVEDEEDARERENKRSSSSSSSDEVEVVKDRLRDVGVFG